MSVPLTIFAAWSLSIASFVGGALESAGEDRHISAMRARAAIMMANSKRSVEREGEIISNTWRVGTGRAEALGTSLSRAFPDEHPPGPRLLLQRLRVPT